MFRLLPLVSEHTIKIINCFKIKKYTFKIYWEFTGSERKFTGSLLNRVLSVLVCSRLHKCLLGMLSCLACSYAWRDGLCAYVLACLTCSHP